MAFDAGVSDPLHFNLLIYVMLVNAGLPGLRTQVSDWHLGTLILAIYIALLQTD